MSLKIVTGRANTGKSTYIYDEIGNKLNNKTNENLLLIVPEQMTYSAEYEIIDRLNKDGIMEVEILSFKRLAYKVFEEVGGLKVQEINNYGKVMLLKQIFDKSLNELSVYKKASKRDGFLREFNDFIKELKECQVSFEFLENIIKYKIKDELLKRKLTDIIRIYKAIDEKTKDNYFDEEDKTELFISLVDQSKYIKSSRIWIDGFDNFTAQRGRIIEKLIQNSKGVTISIGMDPICAKGLECVDDWEVFKILYDSFIEITKDRNDVEIQPLYDNKNKNPEIRLIEKNMFTIHSPKYNEEVEHISMFSAINPYLETAEIATRIISLVRDFGYRFKDIRITAGDIDSYGMNIKKVFTQYDIPYFLDVKRDIMNSPITKYILAILDMFIWNFKHDSVFEYLKTGFSGMDYHDVDQLENFALQYGIEGHKWFREIKFSKDNIEYYNKLRQKISDDFKELRNTFKKLENTTDITMFLFNMLKKHDVQSKTQKQADIFKAQGIYERAYENAQVWNVIIDVFDQITISATDVEITPLEYRRILESGLKEIKISIIPPTIDKISVGDLDRTSFGKCKVLFVMGANEGVLESGKNEKGLLLDDEKEILASAGMKLKSGGSYSMYKQKHTLYKVFSKPEDKLFVSYALSTQEGRALQPSMHLDRIKYIFPKLKEESCLTEKKGLELVSNNKGTALYISSMLRDYIEGLKIDDIWKDVYVWYEKNDEQTHSILQSGVNYDNVTPKIQRETIDKIYQLPLTMSVSKLESFAQCPFEFFVESGLKPKPRKLQKIEYYDLGDIFHKAVEEFTDEITREKLDIELLTKEEICKLAESSTEKALAKKEMENTALEANDRNRYMKNKIKRLVNRAALTIIGQLKRGNFRPEFTELKISQNKDEKTIEPLQIQISDTESIYLEGRIDRVDTMVKDDKTFVNIIDYKSSTKDLELSDAVNGLKLQLFVYMSAIMKNGADVIKNEPEIAGVYYFNIDDPYVNGDALKSKSAEEEIFGKLALDGYIVEDYEIIKNMDNLMMDGVKSDIIPVDLKKDGQISKASKTLKKEEYKAVLNKTDETVKEISKKIIDGVIDINPYKKQSPSGQIIPCSYCEYKSLCQFDTSADKNKYRKIIKRTKDDILSEIMKTGGDDRKDGMDKGSKEDN